MHLHLNTKTGSILFEFEHHSSGSKCQNMALSTLHFKAMFYNHDFMTVLLLLNSLTELDYLKMGKLNHC